MKNQRILAVALALSLASFAAPAISFAQYNSYQECYSAEISTNPTAADQAVTMTRCQALTGQNMAGQTLKPADTTDITAGPPKKPGTTNATLPNPLKATSLIAVIDGIASFLLEASILIATLLIIFGAFQILTSAGSEDKVAAGKKTILYTVIGLGLMLLFKVILAIIAQLLGVQVAPGLLQ